MNEILRMIKKFEKKSDHPLRLCKKKKTTNISKLSCGAINCVKYSTLVRPFGYSNKGVVQSLFLNKPALAAKL